MSEADQLIPPLMLSQLWAIDHGAHSECMEISFFCFPEGTDCFCFSRPFKKLQLALNYISDSCERLMFFM